MDMNVMKLNCSNSNQTADGIDVTICDGASPKSHSSLARFGHFPHRSTWDRSRTFKYIQNRYMGISSTFVSRIVFIYSDVSCCCCLFILYLL